MKNISPHTRLNRIMSTVLAVFMVAAFVPLGIGVGAPGPFEFYVDAVGGSDTTGTGTETNPWKSISHANSQSASGDTILVQPGTYDGTVESSFPIKAVSGVAFVSTEGPGQTTVQGDGAHAVFEIRNPLAGSLIEGFTITGGGSVNGGGVNIRRTTAGPLVADVPRIDKCDIVGNERIGDLGGGISVYGAAGATCTPLITRTLIAENEANYGGGISIQEQAIVGIEDCTIENNVAKYSGGGLYLSNDYRVQMENCTIRSNEATVGGGIYTEASSLDSVLDIENMWLVYNEATASRGGGMYANDATVLIDSAEISENIASADGGGICFDGARGYLSDCLIFNNSGEDGAALQLRSSSEATITQCTIAKNEGTSFNGVDNSSSTLAIFNSIIGSHADEDISSPSASVAYSCIENSGVTGTGVIHDYPMFYDEDNSDFRLELGSPCIDTAGVAESDDEDHWNQERPQDGDDVAGAVPDMGAWERPGLEIERYAGSSRYDTACQMAEEAFGSADTVVLASGENFPDALSAAGLAGAYDAPLLLTKSTSVPSEVQATLDNLGCDDVVIIGGEAAVSAAVYNWLDTNGFGVSRISGNTRYETSAEVALEIEAVAGDDEVGGSAFFARGDSFPDALAAAPLAYNEAVPILLVKPTSVPGAITAVMDTLVIDEGFVLGGTSAISAATKSTIDSKIVSNGGSASERWDGVNRYETAATIAENGLSIGWGSTDYVGIAVGTNFPDALAGGVTAGRSEGVLLLTAPNSLPSYSSDFLTTYSPVITYAEVYGGTVAISDTVKTAVSDALGW